MPNHRIKLTAALSPGVCARLGKIWWNGVVYAAFEEQARNVGLTVERDQLDVREYGIHAELELAAKIERLR
jgi:hypothetical protein